MQIRKFDLLLALYIFCIATAELMGGKTVSLFAVGGIQLTASVALLVVPLMFTINDVIVEVYGRERARSVVFSGLLVIALIMGLALLATALPPSARFAPNEAAYDTIFGTSARIAAASLVAFLLADLLDIWLFSKIRAKMQGRALWLRNNVSNFVAQFVDSTIFLTLAFYAFDKPLEGNIAFLLGLIVPYWILKCCMSVIETPFVYLGVKWLRQERNARTAEATT